ncbi:MAG: hypothetical protein IJJ56_00275 [Prevotella sp.]|nr:hypothetical protein [Prevotella sp.]
MKRYIFALCIVLSGVFLYTSCLGSDNNSEVTVYDDMAITGFSLATVNRYIHTTSKKGTDSIYKKTLTSAALPTFTIEQYPDAQNQYKIYNTDSLPQDCDLKHVLATISTSTYSGSIAIKSANSDTLYNYASTDSLDFSTIREIRVYNNTLQKFRAYQVSVNQHQVDTDRILWEQMTTEDVQSETNQVIINLDGSFIGSGTKEAYALSQDGQLMVSTDGGETWTPDNIDDDPALLPTDNIAFVSVPFAANDSTDYQLMVGTTPNYPKGCVVWRKIAEYASGSAPSKWVLLPVENYNTYALPWLEHINLLSYNGLILAIGNDGKIYQSRDQGLTWKVTSTYTLPEGLVSNDLSAWTVGDYIWLVGNDTGEAWRGIKIE